MPNRDAGDRLRVTLIPPERWTPRRKAHRPGLEPAEGMIDRLLREQHGIDIELMDPADFSRVPFVNRHPLYSGLDPWRALKILTRRRQQDMIISVFESSSVPLLMLRRLFGFKPPIVMWDVAPDESWRPRKVIQDFALPRIDHVLLLSTDQQPYLERKWGAGRRSSVIWQHVDTDFFAPRPGPDIASGPILAIGDDHGRDWSTLLAAVADLDVDVIIKTRHPIDLSVPRKCRIRWLPERLDYIALRDLYAQAAMVVIALKETLNVSGVGSVLEALSMGKPLVISRNPPIKDYVEDERSALMTDVGDAEGLRAAICRLRQNPELAASLGEAARQRAVDLYSKPAFAARLAQEIKRLVRSPRR